MIQSAQEAGLIRVATAVRMLVPPQLEAVIIVYRPENPAATVSSVMATVDHAAKVGPAHAAALERGRAAAQAFIAQKPNNPSFNPQS